MHIIFLNQIKKKLYTSTELQMHWKQNSYITNNYLNNTYLCFVSSYTFSK